MLIVEDSALILMNAVTMFEDAGYRTLEACCAADALCILKNRADVGLVFTDIDMPGHMDGLELAAYIHRRWPAIELLVASGRPIDEGNQLPAGARFFSKPYADADIVEAANAQLMAH